MAMIDLLEKKIRQAAHELITVRQERDKFKAELEFLRADQQRIQRVISENESLEGERRTVSVRIEKILKRIGSTAN
jgi:FtsZ-binding cell division protein ZapB